MHVAGLSLSPLSQLTGLMLLPVGQEALHAIIACSHLYLLQSGHALAFFKHAYTHAYTQLMLLMLICLKHHCLALPV